MKPESNLDVGQTSFGKNAFQTILWFSKVGLDDVFMPILTE